MDWLQVGTHWSVVGLADAELAQGKTPYAVPPEDPSKIALLPARRLIDVEIMTPTEAHGSPDAEAGFGIARAGIIDIWWSLGGILESHTALHDDDTVGPPP